MSERQTRAFLVPSSNSDAIENFERTVIDGVETNLLTEHSDLPFTSDQLPVWGTREGNRSTWEQIREGDYLFFYQDQHYPYAARVLGTEQNESLGRELWPNFSGEDPWEYIIYLLDVIETEIGRDELNSFAGYTDSFAPMGFQTYRSEGVESIEGRYGSLWDFVTRDQDDTETAEIDIFSTPSVSLSADILEGLYFPGDRDQEILDQVKAALNSGKHVIFTGPPGTGKTEIAQRVAETMVDSHPDIYTGSEMTTATADWSTFETVGGYMPGEGQTGDAGLSFEPGQVLLRFQKEGVQRNEVLVIDEINRADIDKAFGQLFTLLSGQGVQLPYKHEGEEIEIIPASKASDPGSQNAPHRYVKPASWRILATMNSYDKTSLYEMSYAFMRRFSFIYVEAPTVPDESDGQIELLRNYSDVWDMDPREDVLTAIGEIWRQTNDGSDVRKLGPAIIEDMMRHVESAPPADLEQAVTQALTNYVFPQLEGVPNRREIVSLFADVEHIDREQLWRRANDVLNVSRNA